MEGSGALHLYSLRFVDDEVEAEFRRKHTARARTHLRIALALSLGLWLFFGGLLYPMVESGRYILMIVPAMIVYLLASLLVGRWVTSLRALQIVGALSNTVAGLAGLVLLWQENVFETLGAQVVMMIIVFSFTILRLPALFALLAAVPYLALGGAMMVWSPTISLGFVQAATVLTLLSTVALGTYLLERASRRDFFLRRVIADQERELVEEKAKQLGQYTLEEKLGQGGMGVVYRARHALLRRATAVKLLRFDGAEPDQIERFEREVQLTSELTHPNVVAVYDYGRSPDGEFYYAMEYLPGIDLESLVHDFGPLSAARAIPILMQVCDALDAAHDRGLIHRDIKPANIILSKLGKRLDVAKVVDFGLVEEIAAGRHQTSEASVAGTPAYMAPETLIAPDDVGPASDLYSLAAVGFFLLTGETIFPGESDAIVCAHHIHTEPKAPSPPDGTTIPQELSDVLLRCLAKNPQARVPGASALRALLEGIEVDQAWTADASAKWWHEYDAALENAPRKPAGGPRTLTVSIDYRDSSATRNARGNRSPTTTT